MTYFEQKQSKIFILDIRYKELSTIDLERIRPYAEKIKPRYQAKKRQDQKIIKRKML